MKLKTLLAASASALFLLACDSAFAQVSINIGGPPVAIGWHQDRYWDGHRYWGRDEWNRRHRGRHGPYHRGPRDDHRDHHDGRH